MIRLPNHLLSKRLWRRLNDFYLLFTLHLHSANPLGSAAGQAKAKALYKIMDFFTKWLNSLLNYQMMRNALLAPFPPSVFISYYTLIKNWWEMPCPPIFISHYILILNNEKCSHGSLLSSSVPSYYILIKKWWEMLCWPPFLSSVHFLLYPY